MKNLPIDYTWRKHGREIVKCPVCYKHGALREESMSRGYSHVVVHKETPRLDETIEEIYLEFCNITEQQVYSVLRKKEAKRQESAKRRERYNERRAKDR